MSEETVNGKTGSLIEQPESLTQLQITNAQEKAIFPGRDPGLAEAGGSISSREIAAHAVAAEDGRARGLSQRGAI